MNVTEAYKALYDLLGAEMKGCVGLPAVRIREALATLPPQFAAGLAVGNSNATARIVGIIERRIKDRKKEQKLGAAHISPRLHELRCILIELDTGEIVDG